VGGGGSEASLEDAAFWPLLLIIARGLLSLPESSTRHTRMLCPTCCVPCEQGMDEYDENEGEVEAVRHGKRMLHVCVVCGVCV